MQILKAFYVDTFRTQKENKEMTAAEVQIRTEEQMRMMSPMVGRIESEFLNPLIINVYKILDKYGMLPVLPEMEERGGQTDISISYVSPLSRAQKSSQVSSIESVLGFFQRSGIINMLPDIYDNIDFDAVFKKFFDLKGAPQEVLRSEAEVMHLRQQRQAMQQQMQQQAALQNMGDMQ